VLAGCIGRKQPAATHPSPPPMASPGQDALVDDAWGVGLLVDPAITDAAVGDDRFAVDTTRKGDLAAGVFQFTITRDPGRAGAGSAALSDAAREEWQRGGASDLDPTAEVSFLGRPGHAFTFRDGDSYGLVVSTVVGTCILELVVLRGGRSEWMTQYASSVLRNIKPLTGGPVDPPRCK
jgi:hypothetical protein